MQGRWSRGGDVSEPGGDISRGKGLPMESTFKSYRPFFNLAADSP
jgi:hypothetical protein